MRSMTSIRTAAAVLVVLVLGIETSSAIRFPGGKATADRKTVQPLRQADAHAIFSGKVQEGAWKSAMEKLPRRCLHLESLSAADCDPMLRCGRLAVRARAFSAWTSGDRAAKERSVAEVVRAADRLAAGGACGRRSDDQREWALDRKAAAVDAGLALLDLITESKWRDVTPVLPPVRQDRVESLIATVAAKGLAAVAAKDAEAARHDLWSFWVRTAWLESQPALVALRRVLHEMWQPLGGMPAECGTKLFSPDLLEDQWRGYLVREVVPEAVSCLVHRLPAARKRRGWGTADPSLALRLADEIERAAKASAGGRGFATDPAIIERLDGMRRALAKVERRAASTTTRKVSPSKVSPRPKVGAGRSAKKNAPVARKPASSAKAKAIRGSAKYPSAKVRDLARRTGRMLGREREFSAMADKARTSAAERRVLRKLVIETHRKVCAPLEEIDPSDIEHAVSLLEQRQWPIDTKICHQMEDDPRVLSALLAAAPGLVRVRAAALMRTAARYTALDRAARARQVLASVPEEIRGTSWSLLAAWAARRDADPVSAEKELARLDARTLDRLRSSGNEDVARLVAHAWVVTMP